MQSEKENKKRCDNDDAVIDEETGERLCLFESGDDLIIFLLSYFYSFFNFVYL